MARHLELTQGWTNSGTAQPWDGKSSDDVLQFFAKPEMTSPEAQTHFLNCLEGDMVTRMLLTWLIDHASPRVKRPQRASPQEWKYWTSVIVHSWTPARGPGKGRFPGNALLVGGPAAITSRSSYDCLRLTIQHRCLNRLCPLIVRPPRCAGSNRPVSGDGYELSKGFCNSTPSSLKSRTFLVTTVSL